jgi:hypothetical protein
MKTNIPENKALVNFMKTHRDIIPESLTKTSAKSSIELSKFVAGVMTILYTKEHDNLSNVETDRYYEDLFRRLFKEVF